MTVISLVFLVVGIVGLVVGAEGLIRGAARLAARTGMSSVVIGLTVVAFGTSAPELAVSIGDVARGSEDAGALALGNVVGSNIANILFALGVSAAIGGSLVVASRIIRIDVPIMIGASVLVLLMGQSGQIGRNEGFVLVGVLVVYLTWTVVTARRQPESISSEIDDVVNPEALRQASPWLDVGFLFGGLLLLVAGSQALFRGATDIASDLGVSDLVIGLTIVAIGTSLPEAATSVLAAIRGERDLAVGNAIGSNLFNLLAVLGITATVAPNPIPVPLSALQVDIPVMIVTAVACLPIFANGHVLRRWEGAMFFTLYVGYITWLIYASKQTISYDYSTQMLFFVVPLTAITLTVVGLQSRDTSR